MKVQFHTTCFSATFSIALYFITSSALSAPGSLSQKPLFVAVPTQPNIFFMLDDSGSMHWLMPSDGVSSTDLIDLYKYETIPDTTEEWLSWCPGANLMAYNPNITYRPWSANILGTSNPFPDQTDISPNLTAVWVDPATAGSGTTWTDDLVYGSDAGTKDISNAPVVQWTDDGNGQYDNGECPTSFSDSRVRLAKDLSNEEKTNFANWFSYYRIREHATKAAVTQVIANTSARMGMATLHSNNNVGKAIKDMTVTNNKTALLQDIVKVNSSGGTPLRQSLNNVGEYFDQTSGTPSALNIGNPGNPILSAADGGECQQNFVMLMTDGQWNGGDPSSVGHQDKTIDNIYVYPAHQDNVSNTLADVAMKWFKTDLAPTLQGKVPIQSGASSLNLDENFQQHLVTFTVAFGPVGTLNADPTDRTQPFNWPTPSSNQDTTVDDLRHAAYNGRGKFLSASDPESLINSLQDVIADIESRQGSAAAVAFNATSLASNTNLFFASFDTTSWRGDLKSFAIDPDTGDIASAANWSAASALDSRTDSDMLNNRIIYTWGLDSSGNKDGVVFNWATSNPQPASIILDDFKKNQDSSIDTSPFTASQNRLKFVRGDTSQDGSGLIRNRTSRLGDIIHSAPLYVGEPASNWPDSPIFGDGLYSSFQSNLQTTPRDAIVYVGANDGMLHGFNVSNGTEVISYLPSSPASDNDNDGLHYLTESDYNHSYYVDGSPISSDVYLDPSGSGSPSWRTILTGSLRGGGQGLYVLDVTDPSQFQNTQSAAKNTVLWEFTNQDDADLGYTFSDPQVAMMNNNKWAIVLGNGYNATGTNTSKLMIIFIEKGLDGSWTYNSADLSLSDYVKIDTGTGNSSTPNGLSTPELVDLDGNGTTDRIYAGDLLGNLWAFDVSNTDPNSWSIAHHDSSSNPVPLFSGGSTQPITVKPFIVETDWVSYDASNNAPNLMIYFGTGQYLATGDPSTTNQQAYYGWNSRIIK